MTTYAFLLGRKHQLSIAELCSVLGPKAKIIDIVPEALIAELPEPLINPQQSLDRLGGTISIAEVFTQTKKDKSAIVPAVSEFMITKFEGRPNKLNYGVSLSSFTEKHEEILKKSLIQLKKELVKAGLKSRFINKNFRNVENAAIYGEKLLENGAHMTIIQGNHEYFYGETKALQNFEKYSERDYDRPGRDARLGMLPPKLAQIMINLSGETPIEGDIGEKTRGKTPLLYDPFAGVGTVLTEGLLLGYRVVGSDLSEEALQKAQKNIDWTIQKYDLTSANAKLFKKDAREIRAKDISENVDLVITESYLGPPVSQFPLPENVKKTFNNINETIFRFFKSLKPILRPGTPIVISLLAYKRQDRYFFAEGLIEEITRMGFKVHPLIPKEITSKFHLKTYPREGVIYDRPDQIVCREVWKLTS